MFSKADTGEKKPARVLSNDVPSLLSSDLTITGDVATDGELQLDGQIVGDINCGTLTVGAKAQINGEIKADRVMVYGHVAGRICARNVQLFKTAEVKGDILHETMSIEAGAYLEGMCKRMDMAAQSSYGPKIEAVKDDVAAASDIDAETLAAGGSNIRERALVRKAAGA